jgi:hypothetical protein
MISMPPRTPVDGRCAVSGTDDYGIALTVVHDGVEQTLVMSQYNAWRAFAMLALFLEIPLAKHVAKAIKLT